MLGVEACKLVEGDGVRSAAVVEVGVRGAGGDEIGVSRKTLQHWVQRRKVELEGATQTADPEFKAAQKRIRELGMENAFLKKAAAFFAKGQA